MILGELDLPTIKLLPAHREWLEHWVEEVGHQADSGYCAAASCSAAAVCDSILHGSPKWDWLGMSATYLTGYAGEPLAYSKKFGSQLHNFDDQWYQSPVHAIYGCWKIEQLCGQLDTTANRAEQIESLIQPSGWIFNPTVSPTAPRTRMKTELFMSMAMGTEVLSRAEKLNDHSARMLATITAQDRTPYLSAEHFRLLALNFLCALEQVPTGLEELIQKNVAGLGYCDFTQEDKRDDYMGSRKRTDHDDVVCSAIATLHAATIANVCDSDTQKQFLEHATNFAKHIQARPMDIPAFWIRDLVDIPFGKGITPLELVAASEVVKRYG